MNKHALTRVFAAAAIVLTVFAGACAGKQKGLDFAARDLPRESQADYYFLIYQDLLRSGNTDAALPVLEKLLELRPEPEIYLDLANGYWNRGNPAKAREVLGEGIRKYPADQRLSFYLAYSYLSQKQSDEAVKVLREFAAANPNDPAGRQELAGVLIEAKRYDEALDILNAVPKNQLTPQLLYYQSRVYSGQGKNKKAIEALKAALKEDPDLLAAWAELAYLYEVEKDYVAAEETYKRIIEQGEQNREIWLRLIRLDLKLNNPAKALAVLKQAPKDDLFALGAASVFMEEGFFDAAKTLLTPLEKSGDVTPDAAFYLAILAYGGDHDLAKAKRYLEMVPDTHPSYDKALSFRAQVALEMNRPDEALDLVAQGKQRYPDKVDFWLLEAAVRDQQGDPAKAVDVLTQAAAKWPDEAEILYRLGVALERAGRRGQALEAMEKTLALDKDNADAQNFLGYTLAEEGRSLDRALTLVQSALKQNPNNSFYIDSLAWVYFKMGKKDKAWEEIRKAATLGPPDPTIWDHYGDIARAMGDKREAAKGYRKAMELDTTGAAKYKDKLNSL
ncbi:MAG: tetratricopeptide repeat protein [Desulfovibrionaceae bacterium]|nr:tetratricopeptide repeat protein [Desulfovibrionaceae bacterium]MBF0513549.1 tetratricopeptide repeat protein [Desulfovibrionaceae bacterium]